MDPAAAASERPRSDSDERLAFEKERLAFERTERDAQSRKDESPSRQIAVSPVVATVLVAVIGLTGTLFGSYLKSRSDLALNDRQITANQVLERQKFESQLILNGLNSQDSAERLRYLSFLVSVRLIDSTRVDLVALTLDPESIPVVAPQAVPGAVLESGAVGGTRFERASALERRGFLGLIEGDDEAALAAFEAAEEVYPTFHQVYGIGRLIRAEREALASEASRRRVLARIVAEYAWGAPADLLERLRGVSAP